MHGLRSRILLLNLSVLALTIAFFSLGGLWSLRGQLEQEFHQRELGLARSFQHIAQQSGGSGGREALRDFLDSLAADPDVEEAHFLDALGVPTASKRRAGAAPAFALDKDLFSAALRGFAPQSRKRREGGRDFHLTYQRVWSETPGGIQTAGVCFIKMSAYRIQRRIRRAALLFLAAAAFFALGSGLLSYFLSERIIAPLKKLRYAARAIQRGVFSTALPTGAAGEIGELAETFQAMAREVEETQRHLEERVRLRTFDLERSKEELAALARITETSPDAILMTSPEGIVQIWNKAAERLFGWTQEEIAGRSIYETLVPAEDPGLPDLLERTRSGQVVDAEVKRRSKKGELIPVHLLLFAMKNTAGEVAGRVAILRDLRETLQLRQSLLQAEKMSAVGQLAAGVAHEINNPLGIILGFAQSLAKRVDAQGPLSLPVKSIEREALRCKNLVSNLLLFSRQNTIRMEAFDLNEALESTLSIVEAQAKVRSAEIVRELGSPPPLLGDKNQIQQVIVNLCNNALDALSKDGRIVVRTGPAEGKKPGGILEVSDNGSGIPEDILTKIFNPFFTTKEPGKGTGLGLSLVYEIVERHKGTIEVKSEVGRGTAFKIFLPAARQEQRERGGGFATI